MNIDTTFLRRCIASLDRAVEGIERHEVDDDVMYDIYRAACVKEFELVLEQSGKLLRKRLAAWFASNRQADRLHFKDLFRNAARHDLIAPDAVERWLRLSMATEKCTLVAIEKCTLFGSRRGGSGATGAGAPDGVRTPIMTLLPGSRRAPRRRRGRLLGGWPWRVPCGVASGSCCPGC